MLLVALLERSGYQVQHVRTGHAGQRAFLGERPAMALLDGSLPDMDGLALCRRLRDLSATAGIILTTHGPAPRKALALRAGADDCFTKPFDVDELLARIEMVLRRTGQAVTPAGRLYKHGELTVGLDEPFVRIGKRTVRCTPQQYRLLQALGRRPGRVVLSAELLRAAWGPGYESETPLLHSAVWRLRRALGDEKRSPRYLHGQRGLGYWLSAP
jgi:DNA-binding response OmpR family regulator